MINKALTLFILAFAFVSDDMMAQGKSKMMGPAAKNAKAWNKSGSSLYSVSGVPSLYGPKAKNTRISLRLRKGKTKLIKSGKRVRLMGPAAKNRKRRNQY